MITALDAKVMDANAAALGVGIDQLMDRAGAAVADLLKERYPGQRYGIFCGHGNNGGDGFAAALHLAGEQVTVILFDDPDRIRSPAAQQYFSQLKCPVKQFNDSAADFDVLVDAALGTGLNGELKTPYDRFVDLTRRFQGPVVSVDVPTGLGCTKHVVPTVTVTMYDAKEGMTAQNSGEIVKADIGFPPAAYERTGPGDFLRYPIPTKDSHKGANGSLLIIGGGPYYGAPAMAGMAAMRIGADLVTIATPESSYHEVAAVSPVFILVKLKGKALSHEHVEQLLALAENADAVLIGPGLGRSEDTFAAVNEFVAKCRKPMVIDADGLNALGGSFTAKQDQTVLTPHFREYQRLNGSVRTANDVKQMAARIGCTIVLKGREDIISDGHRIKLNDTGTAGMTSAGTGDVLAGLISGLLAKRMPAYEAGYLGAFISGRAGELASAQYSYGMIATDVITAIASVLQQNVRLPEH